MKEFYNICGVSSFLKNQILEDIHDFEKIIYKNSFLRSQLKNIEHNYMHCIILNIAKLIGVAKCDNSGFTNLKNQTIYPYIPDYFRVKINNFEDDHKEIIAKIKNNRNKIISHIDVNSNDPFYGLLFSEAEIDKIYNDYLKNPMLSDSNESSERNIAFKKHLQTIKSGSIENERYSLSDFFNELPILKKMIVEIDKTINELNIYLYQNNPNKETIK
jgi:hypothetical protein